MWDTHVPLTSYRNEAEIMDTLKFCEVYTSKCMSVSPKEKEENETVLTQHCCGLLTVMESKEGMLQGKILLTAINALQRPEIAEITPTTYQNQTFQTLKM